MPDNLIPRVDDFERLWEMHPTTFHVIKMYGKQVRTPRWQQAYGTDYRYTGNTNRALAIPAELVLIHDWIKEQIDPRLNGLLLNWYDAERGHYIGKHRDSTIDMVVGAPIVTVSLGAERVFRIRRWKGERACLPMPNGSQSSNVAHVVLSPIPLVVRLGMSFSGGSRPASQADDQADPR